MDCFRAINLILDVTIIIVLIYMMLIPIPQETKALQDCKEKILCEKNMLKGSVCDAYKITDYKNYSFTVNIT